MNTNPHGPRWVLATACLIALLAGVLTLVSSSSVRRGAVVLAVTGAASVVASLAALRKGLRSPLTARVIVTIALVTVAGLAAGLLFREDYFGGSCGEADWPSGHLHAGYPYSWLDGHICVPPSNALREYARQHRDEATWAPDLPALGIDLAFWASAGVLASTALEFARRPTAEQEPHVKPGTTR